MLSSTIRSPHAVQPEAVIPTTPVEPARHGVRGSLRMYARW